MRQARRRQGCVALLWSAAGLGATAAAYQPPPAPLPPAVVQALEPLGSVIAFDVALDGEAAAAVRMVGDASAAPASTVTLVARGEAAPRTVKLPGIVRDLAFSEDGSALFAIQFLPARKREGDAYLVRIDPLTLKPRQGPRLPASARGLARWPAESGLLVACHNEIRTLFLPDLRSGPLYRVLGPNRAVVPLDGTRILVGQEDALLLVDLADPQGRTEMPVRERAATPAPVAGLALTVDGTAALARLEDDRLLRVTLDPLGLEEVGTAAVLVRPAPAVPARQVVRAAAPAPAPSTPVPARVAMPVPRPVSVPEPSADPPRPLRVSIPPPASIPEPTTPPSAYPPPPTAPPPAVDSGIHQARGRITGGLAPRVAVVVLLGPDHLLREAARIVPGPDGSWTADDLPPGRYRVQLEGRDGRVLVTAPPFVMLDLAPGSRVLAPDIEVRREL